MQSTTGLPGIAPKTYLINFRIPLSLPWIPGRNGAGFLGIAFIFFGLRPVHFRDKGRFPRVEKIFYCGQRPDEILCQGRKGCLADDYQ